MRLCLILLALLSVNCTALKESWTGPAYKPRYVAGESYDSGPVMVKVWTTPKSLAGPGGVLIQMFIYGALPECGTVVWLWPGGSAQRERCGIKRSEDIPAVIKCFGACEVTIGVFDEMGKSVGRGSFAVNVGGGEV